MKVILPILLSLAAPSLFGQNPTAETTQKCPVPVVQGTVPRDKIEAPAGTADLHSVIVSVEAALKCYQDHIGVGPDALPALQKASFDFKTTTGKIGGVNVSFFVFSLKASKESDRTNEITFTYALPSEQAGGGHALLKKTPPQPLSDAIVKDLQAAAAAVKEAAKLDRLKFNQLNVVITFGIQLDASGGINAPVQLVTLGGNDEYKKNEAQTVTLTFAAPNTAN
jgi:hypothetical protein